MRNLGSNVEVETPPSPEVDVLNEVTKPWQVMILNDPVNLMSFVTLILRRIFGYSEERAVELMLKVHYEGSAVVWTGEREKAELYVQQLQSHQLYAVMEPVD
ncbi:MAG: ATP-dependent Clp protease adapter ClpS [Verrucomicrobiales bacterium]|mgnify:FL=1|nr:ATP-dependent Clp protease adapter ClpS [Verrucomicrobiales bacterium]MBD27835.1 ATP-dependent Clp protease adapter ClpS [Verrucomicrobiaceae bacterium]MBV64013.1 ATP-dependent Clp protease adapter ClpS [Rickettsiales bacterium]